MSHHVSPYYIQESSGQAPALGSNIAEPHLSVTEQVELRSLKSRCEIRDVKFGENIKHICNILKVLQSTITTLGSIETSGKYLRTMLLTMLKKLLFYFRLASWNGRKRADMELVGSF